MDIRAAEALLVSVGFRARVTCDNNINVSMGRSCVDVFWGNCIGSRISDLSTAEDIVIAATEAISDIAMKKLAFLENIGRKP